MKRPHNLKKNLPLVLRRQLLLFSSIKTSGRFFQIFVAFLEKLDFKNICIISGGSSTPNRSSEDFYREDPFINKRYQTHQATPSLGAGQAASATAAPPVAAPRSFKQLPSSSSSASTESLTSSSSHDLNAQKEFEGSGSGSGPPAGGIGVGPGGNGSASNLLSEAAAASAASQAMVAAATAKFGLDSNKHGTSSSSSSTTSSRMRGMKIF